MKRDRDFLVKVARAYYQDGKPQAEIAADLGISRPTVSNILKECRDSGIVEIRIEQTQSSLSYAAAQRLKSVFGLRNVEVVPTEANGERTLEHAGQAAANLVQPFLKDRIRIGLSWGTSLYQVVTRFPSTDFVDAEVVQMVGALDAETSHTDSFELARRLADKLNGTCRVVQAPIVVSSVELKEMLLAEPGIRAAIERMHGIDIALVGISSNEPQHSALVRSGSLTAAQSSDILNLGAVGHLCGYHFDRDGVIVDIPWNQRIVGISPAELASIPHVVGVACGAEKATAILAVLRGRHLHSLVTDDAAAFRILSSL